MIVKIIWAQRKERYNGEFAPEALECMDGNSFIENPEFLLKKLDEHKKNSDLVEVKIIDVEVSGTLISELLNKAPAIKGRVLEN